MFDSRGICSHFCILIRSIDTDYTYTQRLEIILIEGTIIVLRLKLR